MKRCVISVSNKDNLIPFAKRIAAVGFEICSTGGTFKAIKDAGIPVTYVSDVTGHPEVFDGRVKTLHPKIHGGILMRRDLPAHVEEAARHDIVPVDLVVVNLYPFDATIAKPDVTVAEAIENIDIGGPTMIRASAKSFAAVTVVVSPDDYETVAAEFEKNGSTSLETRQALALKAFRHTAAYDVVIQEYFAKITAGAPTAPDAPLARALEPVRPMKYGCNPNQKPAAVYLDRGVKAPFEVLSGNPGYINLCDAFNAWQLVKELKEACALPAAASFKHVSPAGAAVYVPLDATMEKVYEVEGRTDLSPLAIAYLRARGADPLSSFGDFIALSEVVDVPTAKIIKGVISDGVVAPGFEPEALELLKAKKNGAYPVIQMDPSYVPKELECRDLFGITLVQKRNDVVFTRDHLKDIRTKNKELSEQAAIDLVVTTIAVKYTQSNSVGYGINGQVIGLGAGQQSRVDCVKLAGRKVDTWYMRQHPKVLALPFKSTVKRQERVNARVRYIEGDLTPPELVEFNALFDTPPDPLTREEKAEFMNTLTGVSLSSDAFFPFRDSIDQAARHGVSYVVETGGSLRDDDVVAAADEYGMLLAFSGVRLFHH